MTILAVGIFDRNVLRTKGHRLSFRVACNYAEIYKTLTYKARTWQNGLRPKRIDNT